MHYAHSTDSPDKSDWQTIHSHLTETAELSGKFAEKFNQKDLGYIAGLFHDIGKYSEKFQKRLEGDPVSVDHSTAGAIELSNNPIGKLTLSYCIAGHHGGLLDTGSANISDSLKGRLKKEVEDYSDYKNDFPETNINNETLMQAITPFIKQDDKKATGFSLSFLTRMIYSCLVDADWINTEEFCEKAEGIYEKRGMLRNTPRSSDILKVLNEKLNKYLKGFENKTGKINEKRKEILDECLLKAENAKGLYSLTVPTGGGKTLSSLAFALKHAIINNQDRVIYTIPYTSIIEQNAGVFREIFEDENVLEHHSNYIFEDKNGDDEDNTTNQKLKYASENWNAPIIATTNVQFFESLFSHKKSKCRKLHNIANSVIVMDEAQIIPINYLIPCIRAIEELVHHYNCTVVLCTATQPALDDKFKDIKPIEIMSNPQELFEVFKRVDIENIGKKSDDDLIKEISELNQVLTIVNTKKHAKELYSKLKDEEGTYHLSTLMCPIHRKQKIKEIKKRLEDKTLKTRVFSTQLIEAGVDIDFPYVYRSAAGLDSIAQSAGRCNREGKEPTGIVRVFRSIESYGNIRGHLARTASVGDMTIDKFKDILSIEAIMYYFKQLFFFEGDDQLDKKKIIDKFKITPQGEIFEFKKASKDFNFIENETTSIIIPFDNNAIELIEKLKYADKPKIYLKQLQPYVINLYKQDFEVFEGKGCIENIENIAFVLNDMTRYDKTEGLIIDKDSEALFA